MTVKIIKMSESADYEIALNKGERFLERENFLLAKRELEIAQRLRPSAAIAAKLRQCEVGLVGLNAKEAVKRGRKLEKKGKLAEALKQFEQAQAASAEDWLNLKIEALRQQIGSDAVVEGVERGEREGDWGAVLAAFEQPSTNARLSDTEQQVLGEKKLIALVRLGRFADAQAQGRICPPVGANARYHLGFAQVNCGAFLEALKLWLGLLSTNPALRPQIMALIPLAYREMSELPFDKLGVAADVYAELLCVFKDDIALSPLLGHFKLRSVDCLWRQGRCREAAKLVLPLPERLSISQVGFYARLFFELAEEDVAQLEIAISLWLTAIHNAVLLERLAVQRAVSISIELEVLRGALLQELENLLERYDREGGLSKRLRCHYSTEKRVVAALASWPLPGESEIWPCTPAFAARFGLSNVVLSRIEAWRERDAWDESIFAVAVYFSASGRSLLLAEAGAIDEALAALPKVVSNDKLERYCRQRVVWICGLERTLAGSAKGKTYLMEALPLLIEYPHYRKELVEIALGERPLKERLGLIEALEWLARQLDAADLREATATLLCKKAIFLVNQSNSNLNFKRFVDQAAALCPDSYVVKNTYAQFVQAENVEQLHKVLHKAKLSAAVAIIERCGRDDALIKIFFSTLDYSFKGLNNKDTEPQDRLKTFREFLFYAQQVDPYHPLIFSLKEEVALLEKGNQR